MKKKLMCIILGVSLLLSSVTTCYADYETDALASVSVVSEILEEQEVKESEELNGQEEGIINNEDGLVDHESDETDLDSSVKDTDSEEKDTDSEEKDTDSDIVDEETTARKQELLDSIQEKISSLNPYYEVYFEEASVKSVKDILNELDHIDLETVEVEALESLLEKLNETIDNLSYALGDTPRVYITTKSGSGNSLVKAEGYIDTEIVVTDCESASIIAEDSLIKVRGNTTASGKKKPYNIKFSSKQNVLGMGKAKKWALLANCFDPTLVRNAVALEMASDLGLAYTGEYRFCEVWMDGIFKGSYLLTELVEAGKTRVDIDTEGSDFILEYESTRNESDVSYIVTDSGLRFAFKDPEEPTEDQYAFAAARVNSFLNAITEEDYTQLLELFDESSFARFFLLNAFMKTKDFDYSSVFFYYTGGKFYAGPAWDYDLSSGNASPAYVNNTSGNWAYNIYKLLWTRPEFQKTVKELFEEEKGYLQSVFTDGGLIDQLVAANRGSIDRNFNEAGWVCDYRYSKYMGQLYPSYDKNLAFLKTWLSNRYDWLCANWQIQEELKIVKQPESVSEMKGKQVTLTLQAEGKNLVYQWYYSVDGGIKWYKSTAVSPAFTLTMKDSYDNRLYRCVITDAYGKCVTSETAELHLVVPKELVILSQPKDIHDIRGAQVELSIQADGENLTYQWYYSVDGGSKWYRSAYTDPAFTLKLTDSMNNRLYRCKVTDAYGKVITSDDAKLHVYPSSEITILTQPEIGFPKVGEAADYHVRAVGNNLTYQWYYSVDGGSKWYKSTATGSKTDTVTLVFKQSMKGKSYRCKLTNSAGKTVYSDSIEF